LYSDREICDALVSGKSWAARALYDRVGCAVDVALSRILGRGDDELDDLTQLAFERIIGTIVSRQFEGLCNLQSWSTILAQNLARDALRKRKRERNIFGLTSEVVLENVVSPSDTPEMVLERRRGLERLRVALQSVRKVWTEAFVLHDVLGHDLVATAQITGVSVAAAQSRLVRGRKRLLEHIRTLESRDG
jgi:RNA polymerase sigma-70 factor (ECF subfamily)